MLLLCSDVQGRKGIVGSVGLYLDEWLLRGKGTKNPKEGGWQRWLVLVSFFL